ncbi:MAG: hypothetical protein U0930_01160 [Pirellulales bacterium]
MTDIKDPRLLWAKGAMFLFLGMLAGWLIWIKNRDWETILLLGVFAWAFSRAYYFAFYVIEKYADPSFRYAGLLSLLGYMRAKALSLPYEGSLQTAEPTMLILDSGSDSESNSNSDSSQTTQPAFTAATTNDSATTWRKVIYEGIWWLIMVNLANLAAPSIYSKLTWPNRVSEWLPDIAFTGLMGGFCAQLAVIGLLAGLIRKPVKWTLPFALLISILCAMIVCVGNYILEGAQGGEPIVVTLIGAVSSLLAVFTSFFAFKAASGIGCDVVETNESEQSSQSSPINQISIKYILIATTIIGLLVAIGKSLDLSDTFKNLGSEELLFGVLSLVVLILFGLTYLVVICWLCLATMNNHQRLRWLVLLGSMIVVGSVMMPQIFAILQQQARNTVTAGTEDIPMALAYIVSFSLATAAILVSFRLAGLRLTRKFR